MTLPPPPYRGTPNADLRTPPDGYHRQSADGGRRYRRHDTTRSPRPRAPRDQGLQYLSHHGGGMTARNAPDLLYTCGYLVRRGRLS